MLIYIKMPVDIVEVVIRLIMPILLWLTGNLSVGVAT